MLDAVRAEALKLRGHRATWLMVWIFPVGIALLLLVQLLQGLFAGPAAPMPAMTAAAWIQQSAGVLRIPLDGTGRFLIGAFAALAFAGEYGWNTWKLVIPARARWQLIAAKWMVSIGFVIAALIAADLIGLAGSALRAAIGTLDIPSGVTSGALLHAHAIAAVQALVPIIYTIAWAGLFAMLTGSLLATIGLSIAIVTLEQLLLPLAFLAQSYAPGLTAMVLPVLPFYHMANVIAAAKGQHLALPLGNGEALALSWQASLAIVAAWIGAIGAATLARFARQDLN